MAELPTVRIRHPDGFAIINEADFVEGEHELFEAAPSIDLTPESIGVMKKADLLELLAAHGVEGATGTVAELREILTRIVFVVTE